MDYQLYATDEYHCAVDLEALPPEEAQAVLLALNVTVKRVLMTWPLQQFQWSTRVENWIARNQLLTLGDLYRRGLKLRGVGHLSAVEIASRLTMLGLPFPPWVRFYMEKKQTVEPPGKTYE